MAVKELNNVAVYNAKIAKDGTGKIGAIGAQTSVMLYPGTVIVTDVNIAGTASGAPITAAVRGSVLGSSGYTPYKGSILGLLTDNVGAPGQTDIYIDPVGSTAIDPTTGELVDNSNASYSATRRQAFSYNNAEQINNVTNLTAGAGGTQGPARGVGYFVAPSQVQVDFGTAAGNILIPFKTLDNLTNGTASDVADTTGYAAGDLLTYGSSVNSGKLVKIDPLNPGLWNGFVVARVDKFNGRVAEITLI